MYSRVPRRIGTVAAVAAAVVLATATAASAHVVVNSTDAVQGGFGTLVFRVPNESTTGASTTKLTVAMPMATPFAAVQPAVKPGWTITTTTQQLTHAITADDFTVNKAISSVTWTANTKADGIPPDLVDFFTVVVGNLPKSDTVVFSATQTYSDGEVVKWDEPYPASGDEPENPTPVLHLTSATTTDPATTSSAPWGIVLAVVALVLAALALAVSLARRPRTPMA
jgi:periplasmic copper chaperone A